MIFKLHDDDEEPLFSTESTTLKDTNDLTMEANYPRKLDLYAIKFNVRVEDVVATATTIHAGFLYLSFNLERTFYCDKQLLEVLGILDGNAAVIDGTGVTSIKFTNARDICKLGGLGQINCTVKAFDLTKVHPSLGKYHKTSFFYNLEKPIREVATALKDLRLKPSNAGVEYVVVPTSITEKKSKRTTPHF